MKEKMYQTIGGVGATDLLREDHRKIKELFREFEGAGLERRRALAPVIMRELEVQSILKEDLFYPAARRAIRDDDLIVECEEAHHVLKVLLGELKALPLGRHFNAKFQVLMNNARQLIREEENELMPRVERSDIDLGDLGEEMARLKVKTLQSTAIKKILGDEGNGRAGVKLGALLVAGAVIGVATAIIKRASAD